jgi:hypothetical protein
MNIIITILDIIHRPGFYLKHDVSEAGFCLRLQVEPTRLGSPEDGNRIYPPEHRVLNKGQEDGYCPEL